ncbi:MAG TPA: type II secretion system protein [Patescibacteria group bacterium]|jgi:prepilin-type N-terminal cleavage/methylation domain-containing protein|nr:type II secretion system protein [Patescibacteria group bacterium]
MDKNKGFTLIELLVVISIIGMLATVALVSLNTARAKARDAQRKANLSQIDKVLRMYYLDNEDFPHCGVYSGGLWVVRSTEAAWSSCMAPALSKYVASMPLDPINATWSGLTLYYYYQCPAATSSSPCASAYINDYFETLNPNYAAMTINP